MWMLAAILFLCGTIVTGCKDKENQEEPEADDVELVEGESYLMTIDRYMTDEIGKQYAQGEVCIPCVSVVDVDESDPGDVKVWGDFWVFNYNLSGDTLKTVSGGDHPGLMHLRKIDKGYEVLSFDQVVDGAGNLESAKNIFGQKYDEFHAINSNAKKREALRARVIADYVESHNIPAKVFQDYGWPSVSLPLN